MYFIPKFTAMCPSAKKIDGNNIQISLDDLRKLVRLALVNVHFDEKFYCEQYPDVAEGIKSGAISSGREHFVASGYIEGRIPFKPVFEEKWYLESYKDIAEVVAKGKIPNGKTHYETQGIHEGRVPCKMPINKKFYNETYTEVKKLLVDGKTEQDHFMDTGYLSGYLPFQKI